MELTKHVTLNIKLKLDDYYHARYSHNYSFGYLNKTKYMFFEYLKMQLNDYWLILVKNLKFMENTFVFCVTVYDETNMFEISNKNIDKFRERLNEYFYVDYPDNYNIDMLRKMARFKKIKKWYKMKRSVIVKQLERPKDKLYYVPEGDRLMNHIQISGEINT